MANSLKIIIKGIAERISSQVNDWVFGMKDSGMSDEVISRRLDEELEFGRIITEMKKFAEVKIPGYVGELTQRFARDTLTAEEKSKRAKDLLQEMRDKSMPTEKTMEAIAEWERRGIDTSSWGEGGMPDPPPDAELEDSFVWVAIMDKATCDVCEGNHGEIKTLAEWSEIGLPRSGACFGRESCRCLLVPELNISEGDIPESIKIPRE